MIQNKTLYVGQLNTPNVDEIVEEFRGVFERQFYTNHGPLVDRFENEIQKSLGVKHCIAVCNGTIGLMVAARTMLNGGEVIVPAFTFPATVHALEYAGCTPVFCDVDPETHNLSIETVEPCLTVRTVAILGVHLWGNPCPIEALEDFAGAHSIRVMYDAAHAFGCEHNGRKIANFGTFEVFSFHATKILNCGEGGCLTTNCDETAAALRTARNFHAEHTFVDVPLRINAKMSEAQAAMGLVSLRHFETFRNANAHRYNFYRDALNNVEGLDLIPLGENGASNYQYVVVQVDANRFGMDRDTLVNALADDNVIARRYFHPPLHRSEPYSDEFSQLPATEMLCDTLMQLPSGDMVETNDMQRIVELLQKYRAG